MRTITVRECPCDGTACGPACGSEMVDRLYIPVEVTSEMVERGAQALAEWWKTTQTGCSGNPDKSDREMAEVVLAAALSRIEERP